MLTQQVLKESLTYNPDTGLFVRLKGPGSKAGKPKEGARHGRGYRVLGVMYATYLAHRLAWLYMTGEWPTSEVDHIDGDRTNNRWANLRAATTGENRRNTKLRSDNTSGVKGITWEASKNRWRCDLWLDGKKHYVGVSKDLETLRLKVEQRRAELHGEFARN